MLTDLDHLVITLGFFLVAVAYSTIGHAGASGYTAIMALYGLAPEFVRPVSLFLNVIVGSLGLYRFSKAGLVSWRAIFPFLLGSVPATYFSAKWNVDHKVFNLILGVVLWFAAIRLLMDQSSVESEAKPRLPLRWPFAMAVGGLIGCLSGLTGTGGAIFLTPILIHFRWADPRRASGMSVAFVLLNSIFGLLGFSGSISSIITWQLWPWVVAVVLGSLLGTFMGIRRLSARSLKRVLAVVLLLAGAKLVHLS